MHMKQLRYESAGTKDNESLQREMEYLFNTLCGWQPKVLLSRQTWRPPIDVFETAAAIVVKVELAGVREDDIQLTVEDGRLVLSGQRDNSQHGERRIYHQMDINYGEFRAEIFLPVPVDQERAQASYEHGFVTVTLPKAGVQRPKPKKVPIIVTNE